MKKKANIIYIYVGKGIKKMSLMTKISPLITKTRVNFGEAHYKDKRSII